MSAKLEWPNGSTLRELACDAQAVLVNCRCKCKLYCAFNLSMSLLAKSRWLLVT